MKKTLLFITIIFCLASCKKENIDASVYGKWELKSVSGGFRISDYNGPSLKPSYLFNTNNTYIKYIDNKIDSQGSFTIKISGKNGEFSYGTIYFTNPDYSDVYNFKPGTMLIGTSIADGPTYEYIKIR